MGRKEWRKAVDWLAFPSKEQTIPKHMLKDIPKYLSLQYLISFDIIFNLVN
jgi:hypothetical protein